MTAITTLSSNTLMPSSDALTKYSDEVDEWFWPALHCHSYYRVS